MSESMGEGWGIRSILLCIVYELALHLVLYIYCEHVDFLPVRLELQDIVSRRGKSCIQETQTIISYHKNALEKPQSFSLSSKI
jgi:hypothetical protein